MERTPTKYSSNPDIPSFTDKSCSNARKRKQPDHWSEDELSKNQQWFHRMFTENMAQLQVKMAESITASITAVMNTTLSVEIDKISNTLTNLDITISKLSAENIQINKSIADIKTQFTDINQTLDFAIKRQDDLDSSLNTLKKGIQSSRSCEERVMLLENRISVLEQSARKCNIEISNLPERRQENLLSILETLGTVLNYPIKISDVVAVHRVPHADQGNTRPKNVIVNFTTRVIRDNVIAACRAKRGLKSDQLNIPGTPQNIYVNEHLTLKNKALFRQCRDTVKHHGFKYAWVKHGIILVRKNDTSPVLAIRTESDLSKIK
ncbi:uncharacterized protein LOC131844320 [Achroia grisella]|uniref:uncharacterized protein LOC131844320 n=1 Tax=Achroia grisella TaxID=688607 RepID=UPI0027D2053B|nr:uncharacterized protein LOC131844320 [Achroia grisella]